MTHGRLNMMKSFSKDIIKYKYNVVMATYCFESVASSIGEYKKMVAMTTELPEDKGVVIMASDLKEIHSPSSGTRGSLFYFWKKKKNWRKSSRHLTLPSSL